MQTMGGSAVPTHPLTAPLCSTDPSREKNVWYLSKSLCKNLLKTALSQDLFIREVTRSLCKGTRILGRNLEHLWGFLGQEHWNDYARSLHEDQSTCQIKRLSEKTFALTFQKSRMPYAWHTECTELLAKIDLQMKACGTDFARAGAHGRPRLT